MIRLYIEIPRIECDIIATEVTAMPCVVDSENGLYAATFSGIVYRVCTPTYCYNALFPTEEAAKNFIKPTYFGI